MHKFDDLNKSNGWLVSRDKCLDRWKENGEHGKGEKGRTRKEMGYEAKRLGEGRRVLEKKS